MKKSMEIWMTFVSYHAARYHQKSGVLHFLPDDDKQELTFLVQKCGVWMTALLRSPLVVGEVPVIDCSVVSQNRSWWLIQQTLPGFMMNFPNKLSIKTY